MLTAVSLDPEAWEQVGTDVFPLVSLVVTGFQPFADHATPRTTKPRAFAGLRRHAPKRTRTSTRLSRTRPSTWRVYQFRHRREGAASIAPVAHGRRARSTVGRRHAALVSVRTQRYLHEHMFDRREEPRAAWTSART